MTGRLRPAMIATVLVAAGALAGCGADTPGKDCPTGAEGYVECAPEQRPPARAVTGELLDGTAYDVSSDRGKVVVVNFWGSWCAPCRAEADDLEQTYRATKARDVTFVGVNWQDGRDAARAFERGRVTYPSLFDPPGRIALAFKVTAALTPTTLVLDRHGRIAATKRGGTTADQLRPVVERIAAEPRPPSGAPPTTGAN